MEGEIPGEKINSEIDDPNTTCGRTHVHFLSSREPTNTIDLGRVGLSLYKDIIDFKEQC